MESADDPVGLPRPVLRIASVPRFREWGSASGSIRCSLASWWNDDIGSPFSSDPGRAAEGRAVLLAVAFGRPRTRAKRSGARRRTADRLMRCTKPAGRSASRGGCAQASWRSPLTRTWPRSSTAPRWTSSLPSPRSSGCATSRIPRRHAAGHACRRVVHSSVARRRKARDPGGLAPTVGFERKFMRTRWQPQHAAWQRIARQCIGKAVARWRLTLLLCHTS